MKKQLLILAAIFFAYVTVNAQSGYFIVPAGAYIHISGDPSLVLDNTNLVNNGSYERASDEVLFTGTLASTITGNSTSVYNLTVNNTGGVTSQVPLLTTNALTIGAGGEFNIDPAKFVTAEGDFINAGTFTVESDATGTASFIDNGNISGAGVFNVENYLLDSRWYYVGSPISDGTASDFGTLSSTPNSGTRLFWWDEPNGMYQNVTNALDVVPVLQGYAYKNFDNVAGPQTLVFTGGLNTGTAGSAGNITRALTGSYKGFELVCNPYPSAVDIEVFGPLTSNLETSIWYHTNTDYPVYNWVADIGTLGGQRYIPAMQAFWVRATTNPGTLTLDNSSRLHSGQTFYKETASDNIFRLELISNKIITDETVVHFNADAVSTFDMMDSRKMFNNENEMPQLFTLCSDNEMVAISGFPELSMDEETVIPLGFASLSEGTFVFKASNMDEFDNNIDVYLEDLSTGSLQDLHQENTYSFTSGIVNNAERFRLHFGKMATGINETEEAFVNVYSYENSIYVNCLSQNVSVEIYDLAGKLLIAETCSFGMNTIKTGINDGVYMVMIQNNDNVITQKIIIRN